MRNSNLERRSKLRWYVALFPQYIDANNPLGDAISKIDDKQTKVIPFGFVRDFTFEDMNYDPVLDKVMGYHGMLVFANDRSRGNYPTKPLYYRFYKEDCFYDSSLCNSRIDYHLLSYFNVNFVSFSEAEKIVAKDFISQYKNENKSYIKQPKDNLIH